MNPDTTTCQICHTPILVVVPADGIPVSLDRTLPAYVVICHEKEPPRLAQSQGYPVHQCKEGNG
jgi:hypothetical protein